MEEQKYGRGDRLRGKGQRKAGVRTAKVEIETAETARTRAVEKAAVAEMGKRSTAAPFARALAKAKVASPHTMQATCVEKGGGMEGEPQCGEPGARPKIWTKDGTMGR
jgi:hypothetical protein